MAQVTSSWAEAEKNAFDWLSNVIGDSEPSQNCFIAGFPVNAYECWYFAITGGSGSSDDAVLAGCLTRNMGGELVGRYIERLPCQQLEQQVRENLPVTSGIDQGVNIRAAGEAALSRQVLTSENGEALQVWQVDIPLTVIYNNTSTP